MVPRPAAVTQSSSVHAARATSVRDENDPPRRHGIGAPAGRWARRRGGRDTKAPRPVGRGALEEEERSTKRAWRLALDGAAGDAADEVALEGEEHDERQRHRDERGRRQQLPATPELVDEVVDLDGHRQVLGAGRPDVHERDQQVVPHEQELEDRQGGDRGHAHRQCEPEEGRDRARTVDVSRLKDLLGQPAHEVAQQEDRERQAVRRVGEPHGQELAGDVELSELLEDRDERRLQRDDEQADDEHEQRVAEREVHPRERVRREGGDEDGDDRGRDRDEQAVDESVHDRRVLPRKHRCVVVEREAFRREQCCPPTRRVDRRRVAERGSEKPGGRQQPDHHQDREHDMDAEPAPEASSLARGGRLRRRRRQVLDAGDGGHRMASWARNRLMFTSITGMIAMRRTTASALPRPNCPNWNDSLIIWLATTSVLKLPPVMTHTMSNAFRAVITIVVDTTATVGRSSGKTIFRNTCISVAPSTRAASRSSALMPLRAADRMTIAKPVHIHVMTRMRKTVFRPRVSIWRKDTGPNPNTPRTPLRVPVWACPGDW